MKPFTIKYLLLVFALCITAIANSAESVPATIQQPGTQPGEISNLESPNKCDNCHGGYNPSVEPAHNWRGSMMSHAGRDPIFWATMAIAEQDFDGSGDLCIRCHSTTGWLAGRSTPTDGSGLAASDSDGVDCDFCHKMTNPDDSEHAGFMSPGFIANEPSDDDALFDWDEPGDIEGYYGSGIASLWAGSDKLGPFVDAEARHQFMQSKFHRDRDFCGTCHDVSNPAVGNLAHNRGAMTDPGSIIADGSVDGDVSGKAAFNNPPYSYGIVERTFSEYKSAMVSRTLVAPFGNLPDASYVDLPDELKGGALEAAYNAATQNGTISGHYTRPDAPRYFSCQTCHMRAVQGAGANKNGVPVRDDQPLHDLTGGNYWMPQAIEYLNNQGKLRLGGGMSQGQITAMLDGGLRAREQLDLAATLSAETENGNVEVKVVNHTGHKLISGYPEGRRMWLRTQWFDSGGNPLGVDGEYGEFTLAMDLDGDGNNDTVKTIIDLGGSNTKIYEAHMGMTQQWALQLNPECETAPSPLPLGYDRVTGEVDYTLGDLACADAGTSHETFHFVLNNTVISDNRIPPYGMDYELAQIRNALPVPANQYGLDSPAVGDVYDYYDEVELTPPAGAVSATIELMYQPTSWEYIQFLYLANNRAPGAFLAEEGDNMLEAWLNTGMAEPHVMATTSWGATPEECDAPVPALVSTTPGDSEVTLNWGDVSSQHAVDGYRAFYDQSGKAQLVADLDWTAGDVTYTDTGLTNSQQYCYKVTSYIGVDANGDYDPVAGCESGFSNILCATPSQQGQQVTVPNVVGKHRTVAEVDLVDAGLVLGTVGEVYDDTVEVDYVISQQPAGHALTSRGSPVDLIVSKGDTPTLVCADIANKSICNNEPLCTWEGNPKNGRCVDVIACSPTPGEESQELSCSDSIDNDCDGLIDNADPDCGAPADCSAYGDQTSCTDDPSCRWHRKRNLCLAR
jgi:hypothetical protein